MSWMQLSVAATRERVDEISACLEAQGAVAVSLTGSGEEVLEPAPGQQPMWQHVRLRALFEPDVDLRALRLSLNDSGARIVDVGFVADDDWQSQWRAHAVRACFGGRLWLVPRDEPFEVASTGTPAVLRLDPGLAFGSGSHPTTRLCLAALAGESPLRGLRVLDFGCGSGVLGLAACLLGAREVVAVDHDPQALLATRDNATYNHIDGRRLRVVAPEALTAAAETGQVEESDLFDVVVANILARPLVALAPVLTAHTRAGGRLVLSGLLDSQGSIIRDVYSEIVFAPPARESGWICLEGRRIEPARGG